MHNFYCRTLFAMTTINSLLHCQICASILIGGRLHRFTKQVLQWQNTVGKGTLPPHPERPFHLLAWPLGRSSMTSILFRKHLQATSSLSSLLPLPLFSPFSFNTPGANLARSSSLLRYMPSPRQARGKRWERQRAIDLRSPTTWK